MHRHLRSVLFAIAALIFVSSAWALIFTAMTAAHSAGSSYSYDGPVSALSAAAPGCGFSMEIFPVSSRDQHGRATTAWEPEIKNCYGGSTRLSNRSGSKARTWLATDPTAQN
jgi:hypothetical protein